MTAVCRHICPTGAPMCAAEAGEGRVGCVGVIRGTLEAAMFLVPGLSELTAVAGKSGTVLKRGVNLVERTTRGSALARWRVEAVHPVGVADSGARGRRNPNEPPRPPCPKIRGLGVTLVEHVAQTPAMVGDPREAKRQIGRSVPCETRTQLMCFAAEQLLPGQARCRTSPAPAPGTWPLVPGISI